MLNNLGLNELQAIVESDGIFFRESMKSREIIHRKTKKRGEIDDKRRISTF